MKVDAMLMKRRTETDLAINIRKATSIGMLLAVVNFWKPKADIGDRGIGTQTYENLRVDMRWVGS
jgi:hypothetical protein